MIVSPKIKAFTVLELVVVMALTGILFLLASTAWDIINKQNETLEEQVEYGISFLDFHSIIQKDFTESYRATVLLSGLELISESKNINYTWQQNKIIRTSNNHSITFPIKVDGYVMSFDNTNVVSVNRLIDKMNLQVSHMENSFTVYLKKTYDSYTLMEVESGRH